jgi:hypothetical protein
MEDSQAPMREYNKQQSDTKNNKAAASYQLRQIPPELPPPQTIP